MSKNNGTNYPNRGGMKMNTTLSLSDIQKRVDRNSKRNSNALDKLPDVQNFTRKRPKNMLEQEYLNKYKRK